MSTSGKLWTQRKCFKYSGLAPSVPLSIPLFLQNNDVNDAFFTDGQGRPLPCCRDYIYEALDHSLFWLACTSSESGVAVAYIYLGMPGGCDGPRLCRAQDVLAFAEFFQGGRAGVLARWEVMTASHAHEISTEPFQAVEKGGIGVPPCEPMGDALWLDPAGGAVVLRHCVPPSFRFGYRGRVHLRSHFYDDGEIESCHWVGCRCSVGEAAVGLLAHSPGEECYGYMQGPLAGEGSSLCGNWQRTFVPRSVGWHMFEMIWEDQLLHIIIDNEPISKDVATLSSHREVEVLLSSSGKGCGVWAGVELFHTPIGQSTWAPSMQIVKSGDLLPWQVEPSGETGFWQDAGSSVIEHVSTGEICTLVPTWEQMVDAFEAHASGHTTHPVMRGMLGQIYEIIEKRSDTMVGLMCPDGFMRFFPPSVCRLPEAAAAAGAAEEFPLTSLPVPADEVLPPVPAVTDAALVITPPSPGEELPPVPTVTDETLTTTPPSNRPGLTLECWSLPGETDIEQIERGMATFIAFLEAEGTILPENIRLVAPCRESAHRRCFVYRFGTRRLHFATRSTDDGRLLLVVRCGGGFMDFLDFARRHGGLEQLRLHREVAANSTKVVRLTSCRAEGRVRLRENGSRLATA